MSLASSLNVGVSALRAYSEGIQVVSNNIANVNTVGYKASHAQYADTFSNILRPLVPNENNTAVKIAPTQVGGGVQIEAVAPVFSQGTIQITNSNSDLAIAGNGFFRVKNPQTGQYFVTRAGNFRVDADGYLVTQQGFRVQGTYGAQTKVVYDSTTKGYDVKGQQDNAKVVIPAGMTTTFIDGSSLALPSTTLGSYDVFFSPTDAAAIKVGMPISGDGIPTDSTVTAVEVTTGKVTISQPASLTLPPPATPAATTGGSKVTLSQLTMDSGSLTLKFPADYSRPDLQIGMTVSGPGIAPGTTIGAFNGNIKKTIPASSSSITLSSGTVSTATTDISTALSNGNTPAANRVVTVASTSGLKAGMILSAGNGVPSGAKVTYVDPDGTRFVMDSDATADISGTLTVVAAGDRTLSQSSNVVGLPDIDGLVPDMKVSGEGISGDAYVGAISTAASADGTHQVSLLRAPATAMSALATTTIGATSVTLGAADFSAIKVGDAVIGADIPLGAIVVSKASPDTIVLSQGATGPSSAAPLRYGTPAYPSGNSYTAVQFAFGDGNIVLNKRPTVDSFTAVSISLGTNYTAASKVGDVKIAFNEGDNFVYYGTDGKPLSGIPLAAAESAGPKIRTFNVGTSGDINIILSNGQTFTAGAVLLQSFKDPGALTREGDNLFSGITTAGPYNGSFVDDNIAALTPSNGGLGAINGGSLELSNVDLGEEFSTMITTQRAFQAGSRVITTTDQMLEEAVNLKR